MYDNRTIEFSLTVGYKSHNVSVNLTQATIKLLQNQAFSCIWL